MPSANETILQLFWNRLHAEWLPTYCRDEKRNYSTAGFTREKADVNAVDARDFMRAIDHRIVVSDAGGRFTMPRSKATEVIFWEHERQTVPRKVTLWLEPVITIAAVARLHLDYGWPLDCLGMQSKGFAFDLTAFLPGETEQEFIAGEVKKTGAELDALVLHLNRCCSLGGHDDCLKSTTRRNAHKKWQGLARSRAPLFWAIGPGGDSRVFEVAYGEDRAISLIPAATEKLRCP